MATAGSSGPFARRSRKSIAHPPSSEKSFDKENHTVQDFSSIAQSRQSGKRGLRSHSLGGGELQALKEATGNPQKIQPLPRGILKPSIPPSPPNAASVQGNAEGSASPAVNGRNATLHQSGIGHPSKPSQDHSEEAEEADAGTQVILKTEEEQQAAAREKERQDAIRRRDERRKSLANRRVSFAPEATLHTWNVVELPDDATSSSEGTNATRRASGGSALSASPFSGPTYDQMSDTSDAPSTPPGGEIQVAASPADQRDLHQKKRRRSSGIRPADLQAAEFSSSPISSIASDDTNQSIMIAEDEVVDAFESDDDKDVETEETVDSATIDNDDITENSSTSASSASSHLDRALREATQRATMQPTTIDEPTEDMSMELTAAESIAASPSKLTSKSQDRNNQNLIDLDSNASEEDVDENEMTMDVTQSVGGILSSSRPNEGALNSNSQSRRKSTMQSRRMTGPSRRLSSNLGSDLEDETMEFTTAVGSIQQSQDIPVEDEPTDQESGEMTMELTTVVGGFAKARQSLPSSRSIGPDHSLLDDDDGMDMTVARGHILSPVTERTEPSDESALGMDFTAAIGAILPKDLGAVNKDQAKKFMEEETDHGQLTRSPLLSKSMGAMPSEHGAASPSAGRSPSKNLRSKSSSPARPATKSPLRPRTPLGKVATPTKQRTPRLEKPSTPSKTPPAKNVSMRKTSPKTLFKLDGKKRHSNTPTQRSPDTRLSSIKPRFSINLSGNLPQNLVLTPRSRRQSEDGPKQEGLGSPQVAAVLDRRVSIGDQAATFTPQKPGTSVRFEDPREMELEVDSERAEEQRRESGRGVLQMEASSQHDTDGDTTTNLRGMIDGLTPKKNKVNGRKSLAVGAARGLLGKRPLELDEDDEDATPKRLKGKDHSPVKKIHLPAPPSKIETTGRLRKSDALFSKSMMESVHTPFLRSSPPKTASTPKDQGRFKDTKTFQSAERPPVSFNEQLAGGAADTESSMEEDRIHLRDFLNMTNIRFMELTTTKRRHTVLPGKVSGAEGDDTLTGLGEVGQADDDRGLAACVVAGASTIPMLELYQHSCRELKKYISEGRNIVKEIEQDTYEDNPALFRKYMSASPQMRALMDNQFKNVKTHARLLSKAMWYEWRMKLLDGLKEGLVKIGDGLAKDSELVTKHEKALEPVMPILLEEYESLKSTATELQRQADELASCDPEELQEARQQLVGLDEEIAAIKSQVAELQGELSEKEQGVAAAQSRKAVCQQEIKEAEQIREQYRGWSAAEVAALKARVDDLERSTGWKVLSAHEASITLTYKSSLSVFLLPSAFKSSSFSPSPSNPNSPISLSLATDSAPSTTERFFLQLLRARLLGIQQSQTPIRRVLALLESGWKLAQRVKTQVADLQAAWPTEESIRGDDVLRVTATMLLRDARTKVDTAFEIVVGGAGVEGISATLRTETKTVYGQDLKEDKMANVLRRESGVDKDGADVGQWAKALGVLEEKVSHYLKEKQG